MLQRIQQEHDNGCFVAAVAMILQVSYAEAFKLLFPNQVSMSYNGYLSKVGLLIEESLALLPRVGILVQPSNLRSVRSLRKRTSLIILRWKDLPELSHAIIFDGAAGKILDPFYKNPLNHRTYNRNLEAIFYVKRVTTNQSNFPELHKPKMLISNQVQPQENASSLLN